MLGIKKPSRLDRVSACGKHPAFNDYFSVNIESSLALALASWVEKGMSAGGTPDRTRIPRSFRFWVRGIRKGELILGILRESSDSMGRLYPLMILGNLIHADRDREWQAVFDGFDSIFRAFESMGASAYDRFIDFETGLSNLAKAFPVFDKTGLDSALSKATEAWFRRDKDWEVLTLPVGTLKESFAGMARERERRGFFRPRPDVPGAVFLGGLPQEPVITIFTRALRTNDFLTLFQLGGTGDNQN